MRVPIVFGKRDQEKYKEVIEWLETVEDGWRNQVVKDALLHYVQSMNQSSTITTTPSSIPTPIKPQKSHNPNHKKIDDDYQEVVVKNEVPEKEVDTSSIDKFLGI